MSRSPRQPDAAQNYVFVLNRADAPVYVSQNVLLAPGNVTPVPMAEWLAFVKTRVGLALFTAQALAAIGNGQNPDGEGEALSQRDMMKAVGVRGMRYAR